MQNKKNIQLWREQEQHPAQQCTYSIQRYADRNNAQEIKEKKNNINHKHYAAIFPSIEIYYAAKPPRYHFAQRWGKGSRNTEIQRIPRELL